MVSLNKTLFFPVFANPSLNATPNLFLQPTNSMEQSPSFNNIYVYTPSKHNFL